MNSHRGHSERLRVGMGLDPLGVPQGTKLWPWLFIIMINDLASHDALLWKYVDDRRDWLGNLAMKTMVLLFMLEGPRPCTVLCFNVHITVEYLNKNVSIGRLLQHIPNSIVVCAGSRPKGLTKTYNKEVCQVS